MPEPRSRPGRLLIGFVFVSLVICAGYSAWCFARVQTFHSGLEALLVRLGSTKPESDSATTESLYAQIDELDAWVEQHAPFDKGIGAPPSWNGPAESLAQALEPLEPFYSGIDRILASPAAVERLGRVVTHSPRPIRLWTSRLCANLLGARAVLDARRGHWKESSARLAQIFDIARLRDEPSGFGAGCREGSEGCAFLALQRVLRLDGAGVSEFRRQLEPRFRRAIERQIPLDALAGDLEQWKRGSDLIPHPQESWRTWLLRPYELARAHEELDAYAAVVQTSLDIANAKHGFALSSSGHVSSAGIPFGTWAMAARMGVEVALHERSRIAVASVALALLEHRRDTGAWPATLKALATRFPNGVPRDLCTGELFDYTIEGDGVRLGPAHIAVAQAMEFAHAAASFLAWSSSPDDS